MTASLMVGVKGEPYLLFFWSQLHRVSVCGYMCVKMRHCVQWERCTGLQWTTSGRLSSR